MDSAIEMIWTLAFGVMIFCLLGLARAERIAFCSPAFVWASPRARPIGSTGTRRTAFSTSMPRRRLSGSC